MYVLVFFYDILIYSMTWEDHLHHLEEVLTMLVDLWMTELLYRGHVIFQEGVKVDPEKTMGILEWANPRNLTELRGFIGLCNYYHRFVKGYSQYTTPLTNLTKKVTFSWSEEAEKYF